nr:phage holin family protein [uncultured Lachnoclostridium sp.]
MKDIVTSIQLVISSLGGYLGWFLGGTDGFLYALLFFIIVDYLTGVMVAILQHKVSSKVGFRGIFKKVVILCLVGIGHILDTKVIRSGTVMRTAIIFFYLSNEGISILENVALIGLPVPKKLLDVLIALKSKNSEEVVDIKKIEETFESSTEEIGEENREDQNEISKVEKHQEEDCKEDNKEVNKVDNKEDNKEEDYNEENYKEEKLKKEKLKKDEYNLECKKEEKDEEKNHKEKNHKERNKLQYRTKKQDVYNKYKKYNKYNKYNHN